jgi:hypothetical protein
MIESHLRLESASNLRMEAVRSLRAEATSNFTRAISVEILHIESGRNLHLRRFGIGVCSQATQPAGFALIGDTVLHVVPTSLIGEALCTFGGHRSWTKQFASFGRDIGVQFAHAFAVDN